MLINCTAYADEWLAELSKRRAGLPRTPRLGVLLVGGDPASEKYVAGKQRAAEKVGVEVILERAKTSATTAQLVTLVRALARRVDGLIVQLPLPPGVDQAAVLDAVPAGKDIDGLGATSLAGLMRKRENFVPATVRGILHLLEKQNVPLIGARILIVGAGQLVGRPLAQALINRGATVLVSDKSEKDLAGLSQASAVVITATGQPGTLLANQVHPGQLVIDAGFSLQDDVVVGDADTAAIDAAGIHVTPVPGGVGKLTVAALIANLFEAVLGSKSTS